MTSSQHIYEVRPRKDHRGVNLISDAVPFACLWYGEPNAASHASIATWSHGYTVNLSQISNVAWQHGNK